MMEKRGAITLPAKAGSVFRKLGISRQSSHGYELTYQHGHVNSKA